MKIFVLPKNTLDKIQEIYLRAWSSCQMSEGPFSLGERPFMIYSRKMWELPVNSNGAGMFLSLLYLKNYCGVGEAIIQSNTFRAGLNVPITSGMKVSIISSRWETGMSMDPCDLDAYLRTARLDTRPVVIVTPIGGYLSSSIIECIKVARKHSAYILVDAAHSHFLMKNVDADFIVYSFYPTKTVPLGEGGLIATNNEDAFSIIKRMVLYDKNAYVLTYGFNCRMPEYQAEILHFLLNDAETYQFLVTNRTKIAHRYSEICRAIDVEYMNQLDRECLGYNGYKFIIRGDRDLGVLNTGKVFDRLVCGKSLPYELQHACPATFNTLDLDISTGILESMLSQEITAR